MSQNQSEAFKIVDNNDAITIAKPEWMRSPQGQSNTEWEVSPLSRDCLVLRNRAATSLSPLQNSSGLMSISPDMLRDMLMGLLKRSWSGTILVDAGLGQQKLFLNHGDLIFASSNLIDHRLGEVIYRSGHLTLDRLTESAVKVTRSLKFGQVLLRGGAFNNIDLWNSLRMQILEILRSVFLPPRVFVELVEDERRAPASIVVAENSADVVTDAFYFGVMFRRFLDHVRAAGALKISESAMVHNPPAAGTFVRDLLEIVREAKDLDAVLEASKLHHMTTLMALMDLVNRGQIEIDAAKFAGASHFKTPPALQSKVDRYGVIARQTLTTFTKLNVEFPLLDLRAFAHGLNHADFVSLYLNEMGEIHRESISWISCQCVNNPERTTYFLNRIEALTQFVLQVANDGLPSEVSAPIIDHARQLQA